MTETITIPTDRLQDGVLEFIGASPLAGCTEYTTGDAVTIRPLWPVDGFSSGEQAAWRVLCSLIDGDLRRLVERSDAETVAALIGALTLIHFELVSA